MTGKFLVAVAVVAALWCGGCGGDDHATNLHNASLPKVFVEWDATGATNTNPSCRQELVSVIQQVATERGEVFAVLLDGQPLTTASILSRNFGEAPPDGIESTTQVTSALAEGFAHSFIDTFGTSEQVRGSGQLQGLLLAANTPGVSEIFMWSDGIVNEPGGSNLSSASVAELDTEIARWKPRLTGLKGKAVVVVGVGRGVHHVVTVERAHRLFQALVEGNGASLVWVPTLAQR